MKELVEPAGAVIFSRLFSLGDPSISALELWGAEYQESNALLCNADDVPLLQNIAKRERCPIDVVGTVTGTGKVREGMDMFCTFFLYIPASFYRDNICGTSPISA